ncbi:MAG: TlpA family protein disulfide reductase [Chloroflexota bacterium]|nr:TlpA family protein disulfide reductase [Chloroflexota bacterium]
MSGNRAEVLDGILPQPPADEDAEVGPTQSETEGQEPRAELLRGILGLVGLLGLLASLVVVLQPSSGGLSLPSGLPGLSPPPSTGRVAADFTLPLLDGQQVTLSQLRGKVVVLNFWATWCPPCRTEMPDLQAVYSEHQANGVVILGVDLGENPGTVQSFVRRIGVTYPVALDSDQRVGAQYSVGSLPRTYFIDRQGIIRDSYTGGMNRRIMLSKLAPLLS